MMKAAENYKPAQQNSLNLSSTSEQSSEKSDRNSVDLTKQTIPFVN